MYFTECSRIYFLYMEDVSIVGCPTEVQFLLLMMVEFCLLFHLGNENNKVQIMQS